MSNLTLGLALLIVAYILYSPSLPFLTIFGLYWMVFEGVFACLIGYMARYKAFRLWLERYF